MMREFIIPFATGLTFFLFGMKIMRIGLESVSGDYLHDFLFNFTKTPYHGFFTGTIATILLQSSSAVTVLTIGFINAGLLDFYQSIGIILGTNVGTVATVELLALNVSRVAVPLLIFAAIMFLIPSSKTRSMGLFFGGFSIIFLGMDALRMISGFIQNSVWLQTILSFTEHQNLIGLIIGLMVASMIQSSSATIAMTMGMIFNSAIPLNFGLAIVLGSNIGTCITAILASFGGNVEGKQVATAHLLLNVVGVSLFYPFIPDFVHFLTRLTSNPPTQIAHFQLIFNLVSSLAILPFSKPFAKLTLYLAPK